jgi:GH25 family lysozyme M1 (1,4-beta-N-acetylmuramidase)
MADTHFADISEFQTSFDADAYLAADNQVVIVRAHNGYRDDKLWASRAPYVRTKPFVALGFYQYLAKDRDAATQAREFCTTVGRLRANEFLVLDLEEGSGDQTGRAEQWFAIVDAYGGHLASLYSGESFMQTRLSGAGYWHGRPRWVAAYRSSEPVIPHEYWQHTNMARFAGLAGPVDGSVFHGTAQQFAALVRGGPAAAPTPPPSALDIAAARMPDGRQEVFCELESGEVKHCYQQPSDWQWGAWRSLGTPGR